jgi:hypothetical protein
VLAVIDELKEQLGHAPVVLRKFRPPRVRARFESKSPGHGGRPVITAERTGSVIPFFALERVVATEFKLIPVPVAAADILNLKFVIVFIPLHLAAGAALGRNRCFKLGSLGLSDGTIRLRGKCNECNKGGGSEKRSHRMVLRN